MTSSCDERWGYSEIDLSPHLPTPAHTSPHLPTPPHTSPHLPLSPQVQTPFFGMLRGTSDADLRRMQAGDIAEI